jgi:twitching motility protein PilT
MQTFDQHLLAHLRSGRVTFEDALRVATSPHDFKLMVAAQEKDGSKPDGGDAVPVPDAAAAAAPAGSAPPPSAPPPGASY